MAKIEEIEARYVAARNGIGGRYDRPAVSMFYSAVWDDVPVLLEEVKRLNTLHDIEVGRRQRADQRWEAASTRCVELERERDAALATAAAEHAEAEAAYARGLEAGHVDERAKCDVEWNEAHAFALNPKTPSMREIIEQHDRELLSRAATAAEGACLPDGYQWGADAMESFSFGAERAAVAVRELAELHAKVNPR